MLGFALGTLAVVGVVVGVRAVVSGTNSAILSLLRQICILLDTLASNIATFAYKIFYEVSSSSLLSSLNLASASQRLYTLLGIFMLFRLAFSFIKYIVNPDDMEKGTSKFITNLAVSLALIVSVPWIFNRAFKLQTYIMESNVIGNLILGMDDDRSDDDTFNASSYGQSLAFMVFSAFYRPDASISGLEACNNLLLYYNDYVVPDSDNRVKYNNDAPNEAMAKESRKIAECVNKLNELGKLDGQEDSKVSVEIGTMFYIASQRMDMSLLTTPDVFRAYVSDTYVIHYTSIVSTIALGFLALLFLNFTFDVAIRNVKLCFLQIIAPIPIILNIEPGDAKGDKKSLNWWVKECLKTYVDLFIRVATVYFGVFLINVLFSGNSILGSDNQSFYFKVFMIFGILLFVKQIPDMIGKAFGIDVKGQFSLNPLKRLGNGAPRIAGMAVGGAAGLLTGLGVGATAGINAYRADRAAGMKKGWALNNALGSFSGGLFHTGYTGATRGAKSVKDIIGNTKENFARSNRIANAHAGSTFTGRVGARLADAVGVRTKSQVIADDAAILKQRADDVSAVKSAMNSDTTTLRTTVTVGGLKVNNVKAANDQLERMKQAGASTADLQRAEHAVDVLRGVLWNQSIASSAAPNFYKNIHDKYGLDRARNTRLFAGYMNDSTGKPIENVDSWSTFKEAGGVGSRAAAAISSGPDAAQAKVNEAAARASRGPGGKH